MSVKAALILDLETTGLVPESDRIVEVGMIAYSIEHACVLRSMSAIVNSGAGNPAEAVNRIPSAAVARGLAESRVFETIRAWMTDADVVVGHNVVEFDRLFLPETLRTLRPFVDTCNDLAWPRADKPGQGLVSLALAHGLGIGSAHRAMADCDLLARLFSRVAEMGVELVPFLERGLRPKSRVIVADRSFDEARNLLCKQLGFRWDSLVPKRWARDIATDDIGSLPFDVEVTT